MLNVMMSNFLSLMTIVVMATLASQNPGELCCVQNRKQVFFFNFHFELSKVLRGQVL